MYNVTLDYTNLHVHVFVHLVLLGSSNLTWAVVLISRAWCIL